MTDIFSAAEVVDEAAWHAREIAQFTESGALSVADAYAIQAQSVARRLSRGEQRRGHPRTDGDQEFQPAGQRRERARQDPGILAGPPRRQEHAFKAQTVRRLTDLRKIAEIRGTGFFRRAQPPTIAMGRDEPEWADGSVGGVHGVHPGHSERPGAT